MEIILIFYIAPTLISIVVLYFDEDNETNRDFLNSIWYAFIPIYNVLAISFLFLEMIDEKINFENRFKSINDKWNSFLNKKIRR